MVSTPKSMLAGVISHHSGKTKILNTKEPWAALAKAALAEDEEEQPQTKSQERPKEKAKAKAPIVNFETFMDSSDESEEEYNAETVQDRRRGDKGIW
jgi:hypothetical protein